jgi:hypothetical protein
MRSCLHTYITVQSKGKRKRRAVKVVLKPEMEVANPESDVLQEVHQKVLRPILFSGCRSLERLNGKGVCITRTRVKTTGGRLDFEVVLEDIVAVVVVVREIWTFVLDEALFTSRVQYVLIGGMSIVRQDDNGYVLDDDVKRVGKPR